MDILKRHRREANVTLVLLGIGAIAAFLYSGGFQDLAEFQSLDEEPSVFQPRQAAGGTYTGEQNSNY